MASFSVVNTTLSPPDSSRTADDQTPTTPKSSTEFSRLWPREVVDEESVPSTPTRDSFGGVAGQKPLPDDPLTPAQPQDQPKESLKRASSQQATPSQLCGADSDIEMGEGDNDHEEEEDGSDNESVTSDSQRPSKKKKGQRFFCTEFPPCQLSFTRSEHLARHIRYVLDVLLGCLTTNNCIGSILENGPSSATALADFHDWITSGSMRRLFMSMKRSLVTRWRRLVQDFRGR